MLSDLTDLAAYFILYSFAGWIIEIVYAAFRQRRFVNRGFLIGPFCPIYGFGALFAIATFTLIDGVFDKIPVLLIIYKIVIAVIGATVMEYLAGYFMEKIFGCRWWDYSHEPLNLHGRISLKFSLMWGLMAYILNQFIHPATVQFVNMIPLPIRTISTIPVLFYLFIDAIKTTYDILVLHKTVMACHLNPVDNSLYKLGKYRRFFAAFPKLRFISIGEFNVDIKHFIGDTAKKMKVFGQ